MPAAPSLSVRFDKLPAPVRAGIWMTIAGASFTGMMAIARVLAPHIHVFEISLFRGLFGFLFLMPYVVRVGGRAFRTANQRLMAARGVVAFGTQMCLFTAATLLPLADIAAINFTRPILATIAAIVFLHEASLGRRWWAIAVGFAGAMIVVRPGFTDINVGVAFVFGAVLQQSANAVLMRYLAYADPPDTIALYQSVYVIVWSLVPSLFVWSTPGWADFAWFAGLGLLGTITQRALARAYAAAEASLVVALDFLRLPVSALIGFVAFGQVPAVWVWLGGGIIVMSTILLTRRESRAERPRGRR
jgi:drug/metabolite transporter (DMT)-like permease